jgi:spermidine synthase
VSRRLTSTVPDSAGIPGSNPPRARDDATARYALTILGMLFVCTGSTALLAEQAFEKLLSTLVGASTPAAAVVLAIYFAGLTVGGLLYGRLPGRLRANPLRTYALLEAIVAIWALLLWLGFDRLITTFVPLLSKTVDHFWLGQAARALVAACWILPATIPMGATFPAIVDGLTQLLSRSGGRVISRFYSLNLFGAVLGAAAGSFVIFPLAGIDGALLLTLAIDLTASVVAFGLALRFPPRPQPISTLGEPGALGRSRGPGSLLLALAACSGFLFFSLEVVWTHLIGAVLGNSVYAFAAMLATVLIGLGLGGVLTTVRFRNQPHIPMAELASLLFAAAIVLAISSSQWPSVPDALAYIGNGVRTFAGAEATRWLLAAVLLVPPATFLGAVYPTLFRLESFPSRDSGSAAGRIVAANALGCISGALLTGFVLIPRLGSERTIAVLIGVTVALGLAISLRARAEGPAWRSRILGVASLVLIALMPGWDRLKLTSGKHVYFRAHEVYPQSTLRFFHEDTLGGITTVVDNPAGTNGQPSAYRTLLTNGKFQGNDSWEMDAQTGFALAPMQFVSNFDRALVIGLGTGRTAHVVQAMGFGSVDVNEIAPGIVEAARRDFRHINGSVLDAANLHLILEDGRNSLLLRPQRYDLITIEITSVWFAGATNLFSRDFYALVRERLNASGVFQQWLQLHHIGSNDIETVLVTLRSEFPEVSFWVVGGQGILIASKVPQRIQQRFLESVAPNFSRLGWPKAEAAQRLREIATSRILAPADVSRLAARGEAILNTDRNRRLEYFTPRYNHLSNDRRRENVRVLASLASFPPLAVDPEASGPLADAYRTITRDDYLKTLKIRIREFPAGSAPRSPLSRISVIEY